MLFQTIRSEKTLSTKFTDMFSATLVFIVFASENEKNQNINMNIKPVIYSMYIGSNLNKRCTEVLIVTLETLSKVGEVQKVKLNVSFNR